MPRRPRRPRRPSGATRRRGGARRARASRPAIGVTIGREETRERGSRSRRRRPAARPSRRRSTGWPGRRVGPVIERGASWRWCSCSGVPRNRRGTSGTRRGTCRSAVRPAVKRPIAQKTLPSGPAIRRRSSRIASFEKKPASGGMPAIARVAIRNVAYVTGIFFLRPPMWSHVQVVAHGVHDRSPPRGRGRP